MEDKWYALCDWLEKSGVKVYEWYVEPVERRGVPSLILTASILLLLAIFATFLALPQPASETSFLLRVVSENGAIVPNAFIKVYDGESEVYSGKTNAGGTLTLASLPAKLLNVTASAAGFKTASKEFDFTALRTGLVSLECASASCRARIARPTPRAFEPPVVPPIEFSPPDCVELGNCPQPPQRAASLAVTLRSSATGQIYEGAALVKLFEYPGVTIIEEKETEGGIAVFGSVASGKRMTVAAQGDGILPVEYGSEEEFYLESGELRKLTLVVTPLDEKLLAPTRIDVNDTQGLSLKAWLRVVKPGITTPLVSKEVDGGATLLLEAGQQYAAEASADGYASMSIAVMAGVNTTLVLPQFTPPLFTPNVPRCEVAAIPQQVEAGVPAAIEVSYFDLPAAPAGGSISVKCGSLPVQAEGCYGTTGSCTASCAPGTGSAAVTASPTGASCGTTLYSQGSYCTVLAPGKVNAGSSFNVLVLAQAESVNIECGNRILRAACSNGACPATCFAAVEGSVAITASPAAAYGDDPTASCGATTTAFGSLPQPQACALTRLAGQAKTGAQIDYAAVLSGKPSVQQVTVDFAGVAEQGSCTPAAGGALCRFSHVFDSPGSKAIVLEVNATASCRLDDVVFAPDFSRGPECSLSVNPAVVGDAGVAQFDLTYSQLNQPLAGSVAVKWAGQQLQLEGCSGSQGSCSAVIPVVVAEFTDAAAVVREGGASCSAQLAAMRSTGGGVPPAPRCELSLSPNPVVEGSATTVTVRQFNVDENYAEVDCGGELLQVKCVEGECVAECVAGKDSRVVSATVGGISCSDTLFTQGGGSCQVTAPETVSVGEAFQVFVTANSGEGVSVNCKGSKTPAQCNQGLCSATCALEAEGSSAVTASAGSASCSATVTAVALPLGDEPSCRILKLIPGDGAPGVEAAFNVIAQGVSNIASVNTFFDGEEVAGACNSLGSAVVCSYSHAFAEPGSKVVSATLAGGSSCSLDVVVQGGGSGGGGGSVVVPTCELYANPQSFESGGAVAFTVAYHAVQQPATASVEWEGQSFSLQGCSGAEGSCSAVVLLTTGVTINSFAQATVGNASCTTPLSGVAPDALDACTVAIAGMGSYATVEKDARVPVTVSYSGFSTGQATVSCGGRAVQADCSAGSCRTNCSFSNIGSTSVEASFDLPTGRFNCFSSQQVEVTPPLVPSCKIMLSEDYATAGSAVYALVSYANAGGNGKANVAVQCNGATQWASGCPAGDGSCGVNCGPFVRGGRYAITAVAGNASCNKDLQIERNAQCVILPSKPSVYVGEAYNATVMLSADLEESVRNAGENVTVQCGGELKNASCSGFSCNATCIETQAGDRQVKAFANASSCSERVHAVTPPVPYCKVFALPTTVDKNAPARLFIQPHDFLTPPIASSVVASCGLSGSNNGIVFNAVAGTFTTDCSYASYGEKEFSTAIGGVACGSGNLQVEPVGKNFECSIGIVPPSDDGVVRAGDAFDVTVQLSGDLQQELTAEGGSVRVNCNGIKTAVCVGAECKVSCVQAASGSFDVTANAGGLASCNFNLFVGEPIQPTCSATAFPTSVDKNTPASLTAYYRGFAQKPLVGDVRVECGVDGTAGSVAFSSLSKTFSSNCTFSKYGSKQPEVFVGGVKCSSLQSVLVEPIGKNFECSVAVVPSSDDGVVRAGDAFDVTVQLSGDLQQELTAEGGSVRVNCNGIKTAVCVGAECKVSCVQAASGSFDVTANAGGLASCNFNLFVGEPIQPTCSATAFPTSVDKNTPASLTAYYRGFAQKPLVGDVRVECGVDGTAGSVAFSSLSKTFSSNCTFSKYGSKQPEVFVGGVKCSSPQRVLVEPVGRVLECHVSLGAGEGPYAAEPYALKVMLSQDLQQEASTAGEGAAVSCGGTAKQAACAGGECPFSCTHPSGSYDVTASVLGVECAPESVYVNVYPEAFCRVAGFPAAIQAEGSSALRVTYSYFKPAPAEGEGNVACGGEGVASQIGFNGREYSASCNYPTEGMREYSATVRGVACEASGVVQVNPKPPAAGCSIASLLATPYLVPARMPFVTVMYAGVDAAELISRGASLDCGDGGTAATAAECIKQGEDSFGRDIVTCEYYCSYSNAGEKHLSASSGSLSCKDSFTLKPLPVRSCTLALQPPSNRISVGSAVTANVSYLKLADAQGDDLLLYDFEASCGNNGNYELFPQRPNCPSEGGSCTFECNYAANEINLAAVQSIQPKFTALQGSENEFSCRVAPPLEFTDRLAQVKVNASAFGIPAGGATVTLFKVLDAGGTPVYLPCASVQADASGIAWFDHCENEYGGFLHSLTTTAGFARVVATYSDEYAAQPIPQMFFEDTVPLSPGVNGVEARMTFPIASVQLALYDAVTRRQEPLLASALTKSYCPRPNVAAGGFKGEFNVAQCGGSACSLAVARDLNCRANSTAPGYRNASYALPTGGGAHDAMLVPLDFPSQSLVTLASVREAEESRAVLSLPSPTLRKGFSYIATYSLSMKTASTKAGVFFSPSNATQSLAFDGSTVPNEAVAFTPAAFTPAAPVSKGQLFNEGEECGASALDFSKDGQGRFDKFYNWVERWVFNNIAGKPYAAGGSAAFSFAFKVSQDAVDPVQSLLSRSFTFNESSVPQFSLDPGDVDVLKAFDAKPFCKANAREDAFVLGETLRSCSQDFAYCVNLEFSQPGVSEETRGDGFTAQSASRCDRDNPANPNNAFHCNDVVANLRLENSDIARGVLESAYTLEINASAGLELKSVTLSGFKPSFNGGSVILKAQGDYGAVTIASPSRFEINLEKLYQQGGFAPVLEASVAAWPVADGLAGGKKIDFKVAYRAPAKEALRDSYLWLVPRTGVATAFAAFDVAPSFAQFEQAAGGMLEDIDVVSGYSAEDMQSGETPFATITASDAQLDEYSRYSSRMFNASVEDCTAGVLGFACQPVRMAFSFTPLQKTPAKLVLQADPQLVELVRLDYPVDAQGAPQGSQPLVLALNPFTNRFESSVSLGVMTPYQPVRGVVVFKLKQATPYARVSAKFVFNAADAQGSTLFSYWLGGVKKYGLLQLDAKDVISGVQLLPAAFTVNYLNKPLQACTQTAAAAPCTYRLKPIAGGVAGLPCGSEFAGCASATRAGYNAGTAGFTQAAPLTAGATRSLTVYLANPAEVASSIANIVVYNASTRLALCGIPGGGSLQDCASPAFTLVRGGSYVAELKGTAGSGKALGVMLDAGGLEKAAVVSVPSEVLLQGGGKLAVKNFSYGYGFDSCPDVREGFPENTPENARPVEEGGAGWVQIVAEGAPGGKAFAVNFSFNVTQSAQGTSLVLSRNSFVAKDSAAGGVAFLRSPADANVGFAMADNWCAAERDSSHVSIAAGGAACGATGCIGVSFEQGIASPPVGREGFKAVSRTEWERVTAAEFMPLKVLFSIDARDNAAVKKIAFATQADHLAAKRVVFEKLCNAQPREVAVPAGSGAAFEVDVSDCTKVDAADGGDIAGFVEADPLAPNAAGGSTPVGVSFKAGAASFTAASWVEVVALDSQPVRNAGAGISLEALQEEVGYALDEARGAPGVNPSPDRTITNGPYYAVYADGFKPCRKPEIDAATTGREGAKCHHGYVALRYAITSLRSFASPSLSFEVASGNAVVAQPADEMLANVTLSSNGVDVAGSGGFTTEDGGRRIRLKPGALASVEIGQPLELTVLLETQGVTPVTLRLSFNNSEVNLHEQQLAIAAVAAQGVKCGDAGVVCDVEESFPCGSAAVEVGVDSAGGAPRVTLGCTKVLLRIDSIFPADGVPLRLSDEFLKACAVSSDGMVLHRFDNSPETAASRPEFKNMLKLKPVDVDGRKELFVTFNAFNTGSSITALNRLVHGNRFYYLDEEIPPGGQVGSAKLVLSCTSIQEQEKTIDVAVEISKSAGVAGLNAVDGSYMFYSGTSHQLSYAAYNGQFPEELIARANSNGYGTQSTSLPFNADSRVNYLLGTFYGGLESYPIEIFPTSKDSVPEDGVTIDGPGNYRNGNIYSLLVAAAHSESAETNDAFRRFLVSAAIPRDAQDFDLTSMTAGDAIKYVSLVTRQIPALFTDFARSVASETAFRRSKSDGLYYCSRPKAREPFYCNENAQLELNPAKCGCPPGWTPAGGSCAPIPDNGEELKGACSDGTPRGECSAFASFKCGDGLVLIPEPSCPQPAAVESIQLSSPPLSAQFGRQPTGPANALSRCADGTPAGSCALQGSGAQGAVTRDDLVALDKTGKVSEKLDCRPHEYNWVRPFIEQKRVNTPCVACSDIVAEFEVDRPGYAVSDKVALSLLGVYPAFPTATDARRGFEVFGKTLTLRIKATEKLDDATVEYRVEGGECPIINTINPLKWCNDAAAFKNGDGTTQMVEDAAEPGGKAWLKAYQLKAPPESSSGTWVARVKAKLNSTGAMVYSNPVRIIVEYPVTAELNGKPFDKPEVAACIDDSSAPAELACGGGKRCTQECASGVNSIVTAAGPGVVSGDMDHASNATPLVERILSISKLDEYEGYPYKLFEDELGGKPFTLSSALMFWGWNLDALPLQDYQRQSIDENGKTIMCGNGIGFYEIKASSQNGKHWNKAIELKRLPLKNYFLLHEPSDSVQGNLAYASDNPPAAGSTFLLKNFGCSAHSELDDPASNFQNDKWLCNVLQASFTKHPHNCRGGCDCVVPCISADYCGNCGYVPFCPADSDLCVASSEFLSCMKTTPRSITSPAEPPDACLKTVPCPAGQEGDCQVKDAACCAALAGNCRLASANCYGNPKDASAEMIWPGQLNPVTGLPYPAPSMPGLSLTPGKCTYAQAIVIAD